MAERIFRYVSHPQVTIDPQVAVPDWSLSDVGRARIIAVRSNPTLRRTCTIFSSGERKALETAQLFAETLKLSVHVLPHSHENDRSATGFLPPAEFETVATQFFAKPNEIVRGWERAIDAQRRIVAAAIEVLEAAPSGDILMCGHGGVGTLLYCHFAGHTISRLYDQPANGGGNYWQMKVSELKPLHGWRPLEDLSS